MATAFLLFRHRRGTCYSPRMLAPRRLSVSLAVVLLVVIVGLGARLVRYLLAFPIWGDEAFICLNLLDRDALELTGPLRFDQVAPVLFLWLESAAYHLLGPSELALRLPSLLAGCAALLLFVPLSRLLLSRSAALLAVGLLSVSYYPIRHA